MKKNYSIPSSSFSVSPSFYQKIKWRKSVRQIVKYFFGFLALVLGLSLTGCASENLKAPCPDYGKHCDQKPVNSWDTTTV